jgi:hypothetical protein
MDAFEYISVLTSIIIGLGMAPLLLATHSLPDCRENHK